MRPLPCPPTRPVFTMKVKGLLAYTIGLLLATQSLGAEASDVDYVRDVKPILKARCFSCHGNLKQEGGLRLDATSLISKGGDSGPGIVAGKPGESRLIAAVLGTGDTERMPLEGKPLTDEEIGKLTSWVAAGAKAPDEAIPDPPSKHWAFQPPQRPAVPTVREPNWVRNSIDAFIAAEHEKHGLAPLGPADKNLLLRRVYIDLIGLPPTRAQLEAFLADTSPDAYEKVVDSLLNSPQYGERWARHWMDVWRYSDWDGYGAEIRESKPHIWRWRDWIIESLNTDKGYDHMIVEMLAGDELAPNDPQTLRATGFLVRNWYKFNRNVWLENTVEHTGKAFLAMTFNCAKCHDHMYDPVSQREHYQMRAFFEAYDVRTDRLPGKPDVNVDGLVRAFDGKATDPTFLFVRGNEAQPDKEHPLTAAIPAVFGGSLKIEPVPLPTQAYYPGSQQFVHSEALAQAQAEVERAQGVLKVAKAALEAAKPNGNPDIWLQLNVTAAEKGEDAAQAALASVQARIAADVANYASPPAANAKELSLAAGAAERKLAIITAERDVLQAEGQALRDRLKAAAGDEATKKASAEADKKLAELKKALEAAQAAVSQPNENYTRFSEVYPTTSTGRRLALARWIADRNNPLTARVAINHIWLRHFGSPLVPTVFDFGLNGKPATHPELLNWLAVELMEGGWQMKRIHRLIVTSNTYRMQSSSRSPEDTNHKIDLENVYLWRMNPRRMEAEVVRDSTLHVAGKLDLTMFGPDIDQNQGMKTPRRSVYFRTSKEKRMTFLTLFDSASVVECYRRNESVAPQQALAMINSSLALEQSRVLAASLSAEIGMEPTADKLQQFVQVAFQQILCRAAMPEELAECTTFLGDQAQRLAKATELTAFTTGDAAAVPPASDPQQRARESLVHVLLNHNDFLTVR